MVSCAIEVEGWKARTASFARRELRDDVAENDRDQVFPAPNWCKCATFGILGLPIPEIYGGMGLDVFSTIQAIEGLALECRDNGLLFSIGVQLWACATPLLAFGSEEQKERYLPALCDGTLIGSHAASEPEAGSDVFSLRTTAVREGDSYILDGKKLYITNGPVAGLTIVFANCDPARGRNGITAFLVEKGSPGFLMSGRVSKMGMRTAMMGEAQLEGCRISAGNRLGEEGPGAAIFSHSMEWERGFILAGAVGAMERILNQCIDRVRQRRQFDQPIGKFQYVAGRLVDMRMRLETSRALLHNTARLKDQGRHIYLEAAMAKLHISEAWIQQCDDALRIHGGAGYLSETEIERELRDALGSRVFSGTSEMQRQIIAEFLGL